MKFRTISELKHGVFMDTKLCSTPKIWSSSVYIIFTLLFGCIFFASSLSSFSSLAYIILLGFNSRLNAPLQKFSHILRVNKNPRNNSHKYLFRIITRHGA